jgi:hypothetical protein
MIDPQRSKGIVVAAMPRSQLWFLCRDQHDLARMGKSKLAQPGRSGASGYLLARPQLGWR